MNEIEVEETKVLGEDYESELKKFYQRETLPDNKIIHRFFTGATIWDDETWVIALQHELVKFHKPNDVIEVYINCYGGCIRTTVMLLSLLDRLDCRKIAYVTGVCMSGGSVIALGTNWNELYIDTRTSFLFHSASGGAFGKTKDMLDSIQHLDEWTKFIYKDAYRKVLSTKELNDVLSGKELYLLGDEVSKRIVDYHKREEKLQKEKLQRSKQKKQKTQEKEVMKVESIKEKDKKK